MTPEERAELLRKLRDKRQQTMSPVAEPNARETYLPATLPTQIRENPYDKIDLERIGDLGRTATDRARITRFNSDAYAEVENRQALLKDARQNLRRVRRMPVQKIPFYQPRFEFPSNNKNQTSNVSLAPKAFRGFPKDFNPEALTTFSWRGHKITVNPVAAPAFHGFLDDLWKMGYRPKVIGSHADRNIAGTNTPSLHSHGLAIDIDPELNPVTWNGKVITALPKGVGRIARKWGLTWGGNWKGNKTDSMHFSIPYLGRK